MSTVRYGFYAEETSKSNRRPLMRSSSAIADVDFSSATRVSLKKGELQVFRPKLLFACFTTFSKILIHITEGGSTVILPIGDSSFLLPTSPETNLKITLENPANNPIEQDALVSLILI